MLGRRGLYSTSICAPLGSKRVRVHLVLGGNYFCDGRQRRRNVERGEALPQARANLLVMGGVRRLLAKLLNSY